MRRCIRIHYRGDVIITEYCGWSLIEGKVVVSFTKEWQANVVATMLDAPFGNPGGKFYEVSLSPQNVTIEEVEIRPL